MNQRPLVPTAAIVLAAVEAAYEVVASEELVPDGVLVTRPRRAGGGRDRQLELGDALEQRPDQRALADPEGSVITGRND